MRFIDSSYEIIEQAPGLMGVYKQIEIAARTAYKSEDKITDDSAPRMVEALCKSNHGACLEHGTIYLKFPYITEHCKGTPNFWSRPRWMSETYYGNPYSYISGVTSDGTQYVTTNARVLFENDVLDDVKFLCEPTEHHKKRITVKFVASIGVVREILRHRKFSFLNESTRYCNYSKDKFDNQLTFINPYWINNSENKQAVSIWRENLERCEKDYNYLISECKLKPEEARGILPLDLKSELVVTGFVEDWIHFFRLRSHVAATGKPHPDIQKLADGLMQEFIDRGYCTYEDIIGNDIIEQ